MIDDSPQLLEDPHPEPLDRLPDGTHRRLVLLTFADPLGQGNLDLSLARIKTMFRQHEGTVVGQLAHDPQHPGIARGQGMVEAGLGKRRREKGKERQVGRPPHPEEVDEGFVGKLGLIEFPDEGPGLASRRKGPEELGGKTRLPETLEERPEGFGVPPQKRRVKGAEHPDQRLLLLRLKHPPLPL